ncbi:MAG: hypothetical protein ACI94Y_000340 [Maribacter sp.]|jgi:hypothetical protein
MLKQKHYTIISKEATFLGTYNRIAVNTSKSKLMNWEELVYDNTTTSLGLKYKISGDECLSFLLLLFI